MASAPSDRPEVFAPGALTFPDGGVVLRRQHNRTLPIMRFVPQLRGRELLIDARLPNTAAGRDTASEVRSGLFTVACRSSSFQSGKRIAAGLRTILSRASFTARAWLIRQRYSGNSRGGDSESARREDRAMAVTIPRR